MHIPKLQYPKLNLLLISFLITYLLAREGVFEFMTQYMNGHGYISAFIGGLFFSFGLTTAAGIAIFIAIAPHVAVIPAAILGGIGAMIMDQTILRFVQFSFQDEFDKLRQTTTVQRIYLLFHHERLSEKLRKYLLWSFAGILIASPLPDEVGIAILSSVHDINKRTFGIMCFFLNAIGISLILLATKLIA